MPLVQPFSSGLCVEFLISPSHICVSVSGALSSAGCESPYLRHMCRREVTAHSRIDLLSYAVAHVFLLVWPPWDIMNVALWRQEPSLRSSYKNVF